MALSYIYYWQRMAVAKRHICFEVLGWVISGEVKATKVPLKGRDLMQRYYSNIYWHFTGSPLDVDWTEITKPEQLLSYEMKSIEDSFQTLEKILKSKTLLATSTERISSTEQTSKFCCVCDIPLKDLESHRKYYGDVAIGFNHKSIHNKFNPVLYINLWKQHRIDLNRELDPHYTVEGTEPAAKLLEYIFGMQKENLGTLSDFMKNTEFGLNRQDSFYGEREWRSLDDFHFDKEDVELLIVPDSYNKTAKELLYEQGYYGTNVLTWDVVSRL